MLVGLSSLDKPFAAYYRPRETRFVNPFVNTRWEYLRASFADLRNCVSCVGLSAAQRSAPKDTASRDSPQGPRSEVHHRPSRRQPRGPRPPPPRAVGGRLRRACAAPLRAGAAEGRPSETGDRPRAGVGAGRDPVGRGPHGGRPRQRRGERPDRGGTACRVRRRPGRGGRPCGRPRARSRGLRGQGRSRQRPPKATARRPGAESAGGSAPSSPTRSETSCSTTSGCATSCAGSRSTADPASIGR